MTRIHRATFAALVVAAFAPAAFAQGKDMTKNDPKLFAALQCPLAVSGVVTESLHAKVMAPWDLVPAKQKREFTVESMTIEQNGPKESRVTCRYAGVDSTLQVTLPKNCEVRLVGPWSGPSSQVGATRLPAPTGAGPASNVCKPGVADQVGTQRLPTRPAACVVECVIGKKPA